MIIMHYRFKLLIQSVVDELLIDFLQSIVHQITMSVLGLCIARHFLTEKQVLEVVTCLNGHYLGFLCGFLILLFPLEASAGSNRK